MEKIKDFMLDRDNLFSSWVATLFTFALLAIAALFVSLVMLVGYWSIPIFVGLSFPAMFLIAKAYMD